MLSARILGMINSIELESKLKHVSSGEQPGPGQFTLKLRNSRGSGRASSSDDPLLLVGVDVEVDFRVRNVKTGTTATVKLVSDAMEGVIVGATKRPTTETTTFRVTFVSCPLEDLADETKGLATFSFETVMNNLTSA